MSALVQFAYGDRVVRTVANVNGEVWFVAADVCQVLGIQNVRQVVDMLDEDEKTISNGYEFKTRGPAPWLINESGLYHLIFISRKPEAFAFRRWVTMEVLSAIRRRGF
jgi:prophage antirepressor-like protein